MKNPSNIIRKLKTLSYSQMVSEISNSIDDSHFDVLMAQKIPEWILNSETFSNSEKNSIFSVLTKKLPAHRDELINIRSFITIFAPLSQSMKEEIEKLLSENFENSLFIFSFCLGLYSLDNPDIPSTAKTILFSLARKSLKNDISTSKIQGNIILAESVYYRYYPIIKKTCRLAVLCGALQEKYDALSFGRERITSIYLDSTRPLLHLQLYDDSFELGLQQGVSYSTYLAMRRKKAPMGYVHSFYKCKVCSFCNIYGADEEYKELAIELLNRQFYCMNTTDMLYFLTSSIPSFILSIFSYILCEMIKLTLFSDSVYYILTAEEVRKNMLWGDYISDQDFKLCYSLILEHEKKNFHFLPMENDSILLGKWMYDSDFSIIEQAKMVSLNCVKSSELGRNANIFGKDVFEKATRNNLEKLGWKVINTPIGLKTDKHNSTDIDVLAIKDGIVLIGQLKVANCGRNSYQIWKAKQHIMRAIEQTRIAFEVINSDPNLLFSIFKKSFPEMKKEEIKEIIPIVITSTNYFLNMTNTTDIAAISLDMLMELMFYAQESENSELISRSLRNPSSLYQFSIASEKIISEIDQPEFQITYEEYL